MKINEVESMLGITKANIRFYEKQELLNPQRTENGYRTYTDEDIQRLKQIIILRKLGIPVQQIGDIFSGRVPMQDAIASNILVLEEEIQRLNGSLAICRQIRNENSPFLDTDRYWQIIQDKEDQGFQFRSLVKDYWEFMEPVYDAVFWMVQPIDNQSTGKRFLKNMAVYSLFVLPFIIVVSLASDVSIMGTILSSFLRIFKLLLFWSVVMLPLFFLRRKYGSKIKTTWVDVYAGGVVILILLAIFLLFSIASRA